MFCEFAKELQEKEAGGHGEQAAERRDAKMEELLNRAKEEYDKGHSLQAISGR